MHRYVSLLTRRWKSLLLVLSAAIAVLALGAPSASAYIYVSGPYTYSANGGPSTIERMTLDGSGVQPDFINGPRVESAGQLRVYGDRLYFADSSAGDCVVKSAALDGTDVQTLGWVQSRPCGSGISIAVAGGYAYWTPGGAFAPGTIGRVNVDPPYNAQPDFIQLPPPSYQTESLVTDGEWLYWIDDARGAMGPPGWTGATSTRRCLSCQEGAGCCSVSSRGICTGGAAKSERPESSAGSSWTEATRSPPIS